jgi:uncharacterized protein YjbI with pentapeptide repeats
MSAISPRIPNDLTLVEDFCACAQNALQKEEMPLSEIKSSDVEVESTAFFKIEVRNSVFESCTFQKCNFDNASFVDVLFQACDLSNSRFIGAYFDRCQFVSCKCVGINMSDTIIKQTTFEQSNFQYASLDNAKVSDVSFDHVDFAEASMAEATLKRFETTHSTFHRNNFFKTSLKTVDFSDGEFIEPIISMPPSELKGAVLNMFQAADLVRLWGVTIH